jgi:hypothetical protein
MLIALLLSLFHCLFIDISIFRLKKAGYSGRSSAKQIAAHPGLLLEEKVPSTARRMRWRNRDRRNPPHPAGFAVHLPLGGEGYRKRMRWRSAERG